MQSELKSSLSFPLAGVPLKKPNTQAYTDMGALSKLKTDARENQDEALPKVAKQFESVLIAMLIKTMRQSTMDEDSMFKSSAGDNYQGMHDQQLALELSSGKGMGLAESIVRQLKKDQGKTSSLKEGDIKLDGSSSVPLKMPRGMQQISGFNRIVEKLNDMTAAVDDLSKTDRLNQEFKFKSDALADVQSFALGSKTVADHIQNIESSLNNKIQQHNVFEKISDINSRAKHEINKAQNARLDLSSPENFVKNLWPMAEKSAKKIGVSPQVLLAQAALETGWGQSMIKTKAKNSFNLFNIKADPRWTGDKIEKTSLEYEKGIAVNRSSPFRAYESVQQSFDDYVNFIQSNPRYQSALKVSSNPEQYLHEIHKAGYATDPNYADKIIQVMKSSSIRNESLKQST